MLLLFFPPTPDDEPVEVDQSQDFETHPRWGWRRQRISGSWTAGNYAGGANWVKQIKSGSWTPKA
jgi:hypothetical protein